MDAAQKFWYLFWAYNLIWILFAGYLLMLGLRLRRIRRQIERLKDALGAQDERIGSPAPGSPRQ